MKLARDLIGLGAGDFGKRRWAIVRNSTFTAVYDACVLYPALLRDLLRRLSLSMLTAPLSRV
jgi:hypothetical protein